jgi:hypothetical protein
MSADGEPYTSREELYEQDIPNSPAAQALLFGPLTVEERAAVDVDDEANERPPSPSSPPFAPA